MPEVKFVKHQLEVMVQPCDYPGILDNAFETATITISGIFFVGEITKVQSKKYKDKESCEDETWAIVQLSVDALGSVGDVTIEHPGKNIEIQDKVTIAYDSKLINEEGSNVEEIQENTKQGDSNFNFE